MGDRTMPPPRGPVNPRKKFAVKPGFSMLDWNLLKTRARNLAGRDEAGMHGITKAEVRKHNTQHDCWSIFRGKVYNLTPYLHYHPGGIDQMMKGAGRDCTALFDKYHPWVNFESLIGNLYLGPLLKEEDDKDEGKKSPGAKGKGSGTKQRESKTAQGENSTGTCNTEGDENGSRCAEGGSAEEAEEARSSGAEATLGAGAIGEPVTLGALKRMSVAGRDALDRADSGGGGQL